MNVRLNRSRPVTRPARSLAAAVTGLAGAAILVLVASGPEPPTAAPRAVATASAGATAGSNVGHPDRAVATGEAPASAGQAGFRGPPDETQQLPGPAVRLPQGGTARLVRREIGPDGTLPVPDGVREATWWGAALNARAGAVVLAGHVTWQSTTGPFAELWRAESGGNVEVVDERGRAHRYRISEVHTLSKNELPQRAPDLFGQEGPHRLVLVTCGGRWLGGEVGYESNRIVVARPR